MEIIRSTDVCRKTGHRSPTSIYNAARVGLFTRPVKIGLRSSGWPEQEVEALCAARVSGMDDEEIRDLVNRLHAKRAEMRPVA